MRIAAFFPHFWPDAAPTGDVATALVEQWAAQGCAIDVVTTLPWYVNHRVTEPWRGRLLHRQHTEWGSVLRLHPLAPGGKQNLGARALGFAAFGALSATAGAASGLSARRRVGKAGEAGSRRDGARSAAGHRPDVVLAMAPPLTLGPAAAVLAKLSGAPLVLNLQDVHPDAARQTGTITNRWALGALSGLERFSYAQASAVVVLSESMRALVAPRVNVGGKPSKPVEVIPNFATNGNGHAGVDAAHAAGTPTTSTRPGASPEDAAAYRRELGVPDGALVFTYAGNVGYSQPLDVLVGAAEQLRDRSDVHFVVNGGGSRFAAVAAAAEGLPNVTVRPYVPSERLAALRAATDVAVVPLAAGLGQVSVPSKVYSAFAARTPVLAASDRHSELRGLIESSGAGHWVELTGRTDHDVAAFTDGVRTLAARRSELPQMGEAAAECARGYSPEHSAEKYLALFNRLTGGRVESASNAGREHPTTASNKQITRPPRAARR